MHISGKAINSTPCRAALSTKAPTFPRLAGLSPGACWNWTEAARMFFMAREYKGCPPRAKVGPMCAQDLFVLERSERGNSPPQAPQGAEEAQRLELRISLRPLCALR